MFCLQTCNRCPRLYFSGYLIDTLVVYIYKVAGYDLCTYIRSMGKAISTDLDEILACFGSFEQECTIYRHVVVL
jgi:hypothetical protein